MPKLLRTFCSHLFMLVYFSYKWNKVFKNGPSKICGMQPLKMLKWYGLLKRIISLHFKLFKACIPQILLGQFLNNLSQSLQENLKNPMRVLQIVVSVFQIYANVTRLVFSVDMRYT